MNSNELELSQRAEQAALGALDFEIGDGLDANAEIVSLARAAGMPDEDRLPTDS